MKLLLVVFFNFIFLEVLLDFIFGWLIFFVIEIICVVGVICELVFFFDLWLDNEVVFKFFCNIIGLLLMLMKNVFLLIYMRYNKSIFML